MEPQFWHTCWQNDDIGFHQEEIHPLLEQYWPVVATERGRVFVPLCGKSRDMAWLRRQHHHILGVELSPIAVTDFFKDRRLKAHIRSAEGFHLYASGGFYLLCGDFFNLKPEHLNNITAVYDRAALVALPPPLQDRYVKHLLHVLPQRPPILLMTFEYDASEMNGPPFPVTEERVKELYGHAYRIETLASTDALASQPGLKNRGLSSLTEKVYALHALKP